MREKLVAKLELLQKERDITSRNLNAYDGAIQVVQALIAEVDAEPKPATE